MSKKFGVEEYMLARRSYSENLNITDTLKRHLNLDFNSPEIIYSAYDLQAGTYTESALARPAFYDTRTSEVSDFIAGHLGRFRSILDVGSGELTMYSRLLKHLEVKRELEVFATDLSWSRLAVGIRANRELLSAQGINLRCAVADTAHLPFATKSIDIVMSDHSLEPNGARLNEVLREIFRCASEFCIFIEPNNHLQTPEGVERMKRLGYIFNLEKAILQLGGRVLLQKDVNNNYNELNKATIYIVEPPRLLSKRPETPERQCRFTFPGTDFPLEEKDGFIFCNEAGLLFPIVKGIPILLDEKAILASKFIEIGKTI